MNRIARLIFSVSVYAAAVTVLSATRLDAQDETALKRAFEGKRVILKIDMPATQRGIDVYPQRQVPVEFSKVADRIKSNGIAISAGEQQMITKVHVVRNHIEFHLAGGGYGSFADALSSPYRPPPIPRGESAEEAQLRAEIATTTDPGVRRSLQRQLGQLQRQRQADDAAAERQVIEFNRMAEVEERERRLASGSRFNIRYDGSVPGDALTSDGVMAALAEYVDFSAMGVEASAPPVEEGPGAGVIALRKGMTVEEVEDLLGPADSVEKDNAADIEIVTRTYAHSEHKVVARFAAGVLVDFAITPH